MAIWHSILENRAVLSIKGAERADFLQNLITQDITRCTQDAPQAGILLTPQGKLAFDFLIKISDAGYLLDCDSAIAEAFLKKLSMYKLRRDIDITRHDAVVRVIWSDEPNAKLPQLEGFFQDPRLARLGLRSIGDAGADPCDINAASAQAWHHFRMSLGVPEGSTEMPVGTVFPLEFGFGYLHAIDFQKGCFVGQEVTSRVHRKGSLRKHLHPAKFGTRVPPAGTPIMHDTRTVGEIVASHDNQALILLRTDAPHTMLHADGAPFTLLPGLFGPDSAPDGGEA